MEDLISTGIVNYCSGSFKRSRAEVVGEGAIFTYGLAKADDMFKQANLPFYTLSNYNELIEVAKEEAKFQKMIFKH